MPLTWTDAGGIAHELYESPLDNGQFVVNVAACHDGQFKDPAHGMIHKDRPVTCLRCLRVTLCR